MKLLIVFLVAGLLLPPDACDIGSKAPIGSYQYQYGDTLFEAFRLNDNGTFQSWLHNRLELTGQWHYSPCSLKIEDQLGDITEFSIVKHTNTLLEIKFKGLNKNATFKVID